MPGPNKLRYRSLSILNLVTTAVVLTIVITAATSRRHTLSNQDVIAAMRPTITFTEDVVQEQALPSDLTDESAVNDIAIEAADEGYDDKDDDYSDMSTPHRKTIQQPQQTSVKVDSTPVGGVADKTPVAKKFYKLPEPSTDAGPEFLNSLKDCSTMKCVRKAHFEHPRRPKQFNFPHALIVGWQKTATTSLYIHLKQHPDVLDNPRKEPEFFTMGCGFQPLEGCKEQPQRSYIDRVLQRDEYVKRGGKAFTFEASTHYGLSGPLIADKVYESSPWVKIVISLREPISRAMSLMVHMGADPESRHNKGCLADESADMYTCLTTKSQLVPQGAGKGIWSKAGTYNYSRPVTSWLRAFPKGQVFIVQFEALTDENLEDKILTKFKTFLDLDPAYPEKGLGMHNTRKGRIRPEGWPMKRKEYEHLIEMVKPDAIEMARLAEEYGFANSKDWLSRWQAVWDENLDSCDENGDCSIRPS